MAKRFRPLRRLHRRIDRLVDSPALIDGAASLFASRIRRWHAATDWRVEGREALAAEIAAGQPVIMAVWHGRLTMTPFMWLPEWGPVCSLTSSARPGRIVARTLARFGWQNASMRDAKSNRATSLQVARMMKAGTSIGIACDGPTGPALEMKSVPVEWARLSGAPIWLWAYSVTPMRRLSSWDRLLIPRSGGRGVMLYQRWGSVPRRVDDSAMDAARQDLGRALTDLTDEADRRAGHLTPLR